MRASTAAAVLALAPAAFAKINRFYANHVLATTEDDPTLPAQYTVLPIDHFNSNAGTFKNRWFYNDTFYQPGGPVIVQDVGEEDAGPFTTFLTEPDGVQTAVMQLAHKYKGIGIVWEHRYYGESVPFVQSGQAASVAKLNANQWSYHTFEQALEDVVVFANNFSLPSNATAASRVNASDALYASKTPWLFLGGSYPGVRAASLRTRNPETIFASWASSAPVNAQVNMSSYYEAVERGLPQNCTADFAAAIQFFDSGITGSNATLVSQLKNDVTSAVSGGTISSKSTDSLDAPTVGEYLLTPFSNFQSGGPAVIQPFCDYLETAGGRTAPTAGGLISTMSQEQVYNMVIKAIGVASSAQADGSTNGELSGFASPNKLPIAPASTSTDSSLPPDSISWEYQFCNEFGYFQITDPDAPDNIVSSLVTINQIESECNQLFPTGLNPTPNVTSVTQYGGWTQNPTRVMFTNGELDPWRTLSVASTEPGAPNRQATTTVPGFDSAPDGSQFYGVVYTGQVHAVDFFSAPGQPADRNAAFQTGFKMFTAALDQWLPNFKAGNDLVITAPTGTVTGTAALATSSQSSKPKPSKGSNTNGAASVAGRGGVVYSVAALAVVIMAWC